VGDMASGAGVFKAVFGGIDIIRLSGQSLSFINSSGFTMPGVIRLYGSAAGNLQSVVHEFGHIFDFKVTGHFHTNDQMLGPNGLSPDLIDSINGDSVDYGYSPLYPGGALGVERFADMFMGYVLGGFDLSNNAGIQRNEFMQYEMYWALQAYTH